MNGTTKTDTRSAALFDSLPVLSDEQVEVRLDRTETHSIRCFVGIHKKVVSFWPAGDCPKVARHIECERCGELLEIQILPSKRRPNPESE